MEVVGRHVSANTAFNNERLTHPFIDDESKIVGRENDVLKVVKMLCDDDDDVNLSVIAIVGLGGQGRTTLAQLVCKNESVVKHFDSNMIIWVCVSEEFVVTTLLNEMVQFFTGKNLELSNVQAVIKNELGPNLKHKRYLLVLDDVWNEDEDKWRSFKRALLGISGAKGSKVMVTTRNTEVASRMQASSHLLGKLSDEESWTMFKQRAFAHGGSPETDALKKIGTEIVKRCIGLPLAIKAIGSLMYSKKLENDWLSVQNNQLWNIEDDAKRVLQTLKLSYDHLSFPLKRCFCFCSIYPKDKVIRKDELIQCWMALGLLQVPSDSDQAMEDVGEGHFKTLLSMCLLQDPVKDEFGAIESCKIHDIVYDLALITTKTDYSTLQSVAQVSSKHVNPQSHLRLLDSNDLSVRGYSFKKMKHLRYLDISKIDLRDLTSSFTTCYNLHTIKFSHLYSVSEHLGKLINLRHLCVDDISWSGKCWLTGIGRLTCLQTLPFFGINREHGCHITELESLNNLRDDLVIFGLDDVVNYEEAKGAFLSKKQNLRGLRLCWGMPVDFDSDYSYTYQDSDNTESVLEGLEPHSNLKCLTIENFKGRNFPQWMMVETKVLGNLVHLELQNCDECERLPSLGHLQHLKVFKIISLSNVKEIGLEFYGSGIGSGGVSLFPVLRKLVIVDMPKLERWLEAVPQSSVSSKIIAFPCLEEFYIEGCPNLESFPSHFPRLEMLDIDRCQNLKIFPSHMPSITELSISDCGRLTSLPEELGKTLRELKLNGCDALVSFPAFQYLQSLSLDYTYGSTEERGPSDLSLTFSSEFQFLEYLVLGGFPELKSLPDKIQHQNALKTLSIYNLESLESLPDWLGNLISLTTLDINWCVKLKYFPSVEAMKRLINLSILYIGYCPLLEERCTKGAGPEWRKISHIPNIFFIS